MKRGEPPQVFKAKYLIEGNEFKLVDRPESWEGAEFWNWEIDPEGERLLVRRQPQRTEETRIDSVVLIQNFFEHLKNELPTP